MSVIEAKGLSKTYFLKNESKEEFHALKNASFHLNQGESVGIIGRNGAGKSTLLKILTGVTLPTVGEARIEGKFSSLLEIGTGFHPDLSGKDNIYLNSSILGVSKKEVSTELQNIIYFSGVERFIDQPLRTYSSGMKLRLAFAIIAHLKTDIIALDEVLAVGDSMFQIKCMERIFSFKEQGRTVLFVSHNLSAVRKLCERTLVLVNGEIAFDGPTDEAIEFYTRSNQTEAQLSDSEWVQNIDIRCEEREAIIKFSVQNLTSESELDLGININSEAGLPLYHFSNRFNETKLTPKDGCLNLTVQFHHNLKPGRYPISIYIGQEEQQLVWLEAVAYLQVPDYNPYGFHNPDAIQGPIITDFDITQS